MSLKEMFSVLRHKEVPAGEWTASGPGGKTYTVISHSRAHVPEKANSGEITFVVQTDGGVNQTLVGTVAEDKSETITRDGETLPEPNIDGGIAGKPILRGFPPKVKLRGVVIVKFDFKDETAPDGLAEYRFEGKVGDIDLN